jgi:glyceraldehyde 3-phosphate dehydrogenase
VAIKVGINGFGRIGRLVYRVVMNNDAVDIVAVNDITDTKTLAHLLKYDSVHGIIGGPVTVNGDSITAGKDSFKVTAERDPAKLPWKELGVDIVIESTGLFTKRELAAKHLEAGAKSVLISAPSSDADGVFVFGVNDKSFDKNKHKIISIGSCTTNCLAPVAKVLNDTFGIKYGFMTTIHAFTNDQRILDLPHKDLRRARAAAVSAIPTSTGAAKAISQVIPELAGKLDGFAIRIPTPDGSLVDLTAVVEKTATIDAINQAMKKAAEGPMKGYLEYCSDPIVSVDVIHNPHSSVFDSLTTKVINGNLVKILSWYDNEWGFSNRMVDMLLKMA